MNKLSSKFITGITVILLLTMAFSLYINSNLIARYYIYEKKGDLDQICSQLEQAVMSGGEEQAVISGLEETREVTIARLDRTENLESINEELRAVMREKGIGFQKFWLWDKDYEAALNNGRTVRIYNQGKLNYSLLVEYMGLGTDFYAVAMIIPDVSDAIQIVSTVTSLVMAMALLVAIVLIVILVKRITRPLEQLRRLADDTAARKFGQVKVETRDELAAVAASMNQMSLEIQRYQAELLDKNRQMEDLLNNVAHDLKTPVALIKAYAEGMRDGMDDGSFLDTIVRQNERMGDLVENLLLLSRMERAELPARQLELCGILERILEEKTVLARREDITVQTDLCPKAVIFGNQEIVTLIFDNLLSNALKYSSGSTVGVLLGEEEDGYLFQVINETASAPDLSRLWEPFYVGEKSRNRDMSGTGLGLALVRGGAEKMGYPVACSLEGEEIRFSVKFMKFRESLEGEDNLC